MRRCDLCLGWGVKLYEHVDQPIPITKMEVFDDKNAEGKTFAPCPKCGSGKDNPTDKDRDWVT